MIYHRRSLVGLMLWLRYGLLAGRPGRSLDEIYAQHLESPGTKAYSPARARRCSPGSATCGSRASSVRGTCCRAPPASGTAGRSSTPRGGSIRAGRSGFLRLRPYLLIEARRPGGPGAAVRRTRRRLRSRPRRRAVVRRRRAHEPRGLARAGRHRRRRLVHARHAEGRARRAPDAARPGGSPRARRAPRRELERLPAAAQAAVRPRRGLARTVGLFPPPTCSSCSRRCSRRSPSRR